ncbi:MAG: ABC transporter ATP-binding protein [Chloroflexi bacterium HGW-Chloroflexi-3]|nr:MAG: ABC transporter ATP-binding protein [Chloroflexi bacterium HGW-Chloroflexi-3]
MSIAIQTTHLTRDFGTVRAVDQITFEVDSGSLFGFLGPNGSGKTTTIRLLLGLLEPTQGNSSVLGYDPISQGDLVRQNCGALLEHTGLYERLTAAENLEFYARVFRLSAQERQTRIKELFSNMGLWDHKDETVKAWSRGMKQKLAVARAMLHRPKVIFLDEPTAGLDPVAASAFREDLQNLVRQSGVTVFLTTHNLNEAEKLCDRVGVIRAGRLLAIGSPDELRLRNGNPYIDVVGSGFSPEVMRKLEQHPKITSVLQQDHHVRVQFEIGFDSSSLIPLLVEHGINIEEIRKGRSSLEDVFLTLMEEENA